MFVCDSGGNSQWLFEVRNQQGGEINSWDTLSLHCMTIVEPASHCRSLGMVCI